jgi:acyl-CoA thioesterase-1
MIPSIQYQPSNLLHFVTLNLIIILSLLLTTIPSLAWAENPCRILVFGDSLSAGYGLPKNQAFPKVLEQSLIDKQHHVEVINGGVSGDTTTSALARLDWQLFDKPGFIIIELGANDMLRGLPNPQTEKNLNLIIQKIKKQNILVLLTGMKALPNMGEDYATKFNNIYPRLASKHNVPFYPFFLDGVATKSHLNLKDQIHPNAQGIREIVVRITPHVEKILPLCKPTG